MGTIPREGKRENDEEVDEGTMKEERGFYDGLK